jgi:sugar fermentation stimulation protein A
MTVLATFSSPLLRGRLVERYKRFFADVELDGGELVTAHCPNPGSMKGCSIPGGIVWLSESPGQKRKLKYTWEIAKVGGARVFVNPVRANDVVARALGRRQIAELAAYSDVLREVRHGKSRIDFMLSAGVQRCYVEVKNVTLGLGAGRAAFPDSVTERGRRHLEELEVIHGNGARAVMLFCVSRTDAVSVEPAVDIDPLYAEALRKAASRGVELLAYKARVTLRGVALGRRLPVLLRPPARAAS